ncbi:MAG: serine hydrolase domain-containing protein [Dehalococcoidia bacterium]
MTTATVEIHGTVAPGFEPVREAFAANFESGQEAGASFAATVEGEPVVDIWAGTRDIAGTLPWQKDTLVNVFSTTKATVATACAMLVDRGVLDYGQKVAHYWPEFAQNGKADITVGQLLSHQAGIPGITNRPLENWYDWDAVAEALAAETPWWEPGTANGYHAITFGQLGGELVRRVTGKSFGTFLREEIAGPLGADFLCGFGPEEDARCGEVIAPAQSFADMPADALMNKIMVNPPFQLNEANDRAWRAAEIPAANGHANARSCARIMSALACGGEVDGVRLMSEATVEKAIAEQCYRPDLVLLQPMRWGAGFMLASKDLPISPNPRTFGHGGAGGSLAIADLDARASWSYVMNRMASTTVGDVRGGALGAAFYQSLAER